MRLSVVPSFGRLWLLPHLAALEGRPARVRIEPVFEHRVAEVGTGGVDLAVRYGRGRWPGLDVRLLFRETLFPVASAELARHLGPNPSAQRLAQAPLLHDSDASQWRRWLADAGVRFRPKAADRRFEDYDLVLHAAQAGLGIALLRMPLASDWLGPGRLVRLNGTAMPNVSAHYLVGPKGGMGAAQGMVADGLMAMSRDSPLRTE